MLAWHEDAVAVYVGAPYEELLPWGGCTPGTARWWGFEVSSPGANRTTVISLKGEEIVVGIDGIVGYEITMTPDQGLPLNQMIDSNQAIVIALRSGISAGENLVDIRTERFDSVTNTIISPSWRLTYGHPYDFSQQQVIIIDAVTGEVLRNDFVKQESSTPPFHCPCKD